MFRWFTTVFFMFIAMFCVQANAKDYYVCDIGGDDSNNGKSQSSPWETFDKGMGQVTRFSDGDNIFYCRGGNFYQGTHSRLMTKGCSASQPCSIGAYGTGDDPVFWSNPNKSALFEIFGVGHTKDNLNLHLTIENTVWKGRHSFRGLLMSGDVKYLTLNNNVIDNFRLGLHIASAPNYEQDHLTVTNNTFTNNSAAGFLGGHGSNILIHNNTFDRNGFRTPVLDHALYTSYLTNSRVTNNTFTRSTHRLKKGVNITAITQAKTANVTAADHGLSNGDEVFIADIGGMLLIEGSWFTATVVDDNNFTIDTDTTGYNAYTSGGKAYGDTGVCSAVVYVHHGKADGLYIAGNTINESPNASLDTCWGIAVDAGYSTDDEKFKNVMIELNDVNYVGGVGINCSDCGDSTIRLNNIKMKAGPVLTKCLYMADGPDTFISTGNLIENNFCHLEEGVNNNEYYVGVDTNDLKDVTIKDNRIIFGAEGASCLKHHSNATVSGNKCVNELIKTENTTVFNVP